MVLVGIVAFVVVGSQASAGAVSSCQLAGSWVQTTDGQSSTWVIAADGQARESGLGSAHGTARLVGDILTITSFPSDPSYNGVYRWQLGQDCSGTGTLTFTNAPRAGQSLPSTVKGPPASPTRWSVRAYANNVRVVAPLIGAYQLGKFTLSGSGAIAANGAVTGTLSDVDHNTQPAITLFVKMRVVSGTLSTSGPATTLTLTVEVTSSDRAKGECPTGQTGTVVLTENPTLLPNGQNSDFFTEKWSNPPFCGHVHGTDNRPGGARTSPPSGGYPGGGQWAIVQIS